MNSVLVWIAERACEILLGAGLLRLLAGTNYSTEHPGFWGDIVLNTILVAKFYLASLFLFSEAIFGLVWRSRFPIRHALAMATLFAFHGMGFELWVEGGRVLGNWLLLMTLGLRTVGLINYLGGTVLGALKRP